MKKIFCLSLYFKIRKFIFRQSESCVLTMSSWSRRVKIRGLKSSIAVQLPTVSGNLKKMLYSSLCTSFVSCYCILTEKIDENGSVVTIDHFSRLRVGSLLISYIWKAISVFIQHFPISGIRIPDIGKSISDIGKWSISRYREMIFGYRELIFRYREMCLISRYREINSRYPKIATRQKQVTPPSCNTALPHRPLSTMAPSYTGPICLRTPSLRLQ